MKVQNSLSAQLEHINLSHENIIKLSKAYLQALTSNEANVHVELEANDGTLSTVLIPSNIFLSNELKRLNESFRNVVGLTADGKARLIANDGTFRELLISSFLSAFRPVHADMSLSTNISTKVNSTIESLMSPLTEVELQLSNRFSSISGAYVTKVLVNDLTHIRNGITYGELRRILATNQIKHEIVTFDADIYYKRIRYYGDFLVESVTINSKNQYECKFSTLTYSDSNNIYQNTKQLAVGDKVVLSNGTVLFEVVKIVEALQTVVLKNIAGVGSIDRNDVLVFRESNDNGVTIRVPVRIHEKAVIFVEVIDKTTNTASAKSDAIIFNSDDFLVEQDGLTLSFNDYFSAKVADIGKHLEAIIRENSIPASSGEILNKPELIENDFHEVQINKHLTNTPSIEKLKKLNDEKQIAFNKINVLTNSISELQKKLSEGNYSSAVKKQADQTLLNQYIDDKVRQTTLVASLANDLRVSLLENNNAKISAKYRVRGFWKVDNPPTQKIVQYEIRYMYVSTTGKTANADSMIYTDGDNKVNAVFSAWNFVKTEPLRKKILSGGVIKWDDNNTSDTEQHSINQLDIPLNYGESVEFQVRAISEAGYPNTPIMSEWSNVVRISFPQELLYESDVAALQRQNNDDALKVAVMNEFAIQGITKHLAKSFTEQEKYFAHMLDDIGSGKTNTEQKQISALTYIQTLEEKIEKLSNIVDRRYSTISVQLLDGNMTHDILHFSKINVFAGNYTDIVDINSKNNWGDIVEKTYYVKLTNKHGQTAEILSISPGARTQFTENNKYQDIPVVINSTNSVINQRKAQIFYLRKHDIDGDKVLFDRVNSTSSISISENDIDNSANIADKNVVNLTGNNVSLVALSRNSTMNFATITRNHEAYKLYSSTGNISHVRNALQRLSKLNILHKQNNGQNILTETSITKFEQSDKYSVGSNTCGSTLFVDLNNIESYQVQGIDTSSSKEIYDGDSNAILIPIKFQYRMTDALGYPDADTAKTAANNFTYSKTLGFDILLSGKIFSFDITVSANFRATTNTNNVIGSYDTSSNTHINIQD